MPMSGASKVPQAIRILIADDHPVVRDGIAFTARAEGDMTVVAEATTGQEAIDQFRAHRPDVTLMDLQMPGMNGIDAMLVIREEFPAARILVITTYSGDVQAARALKAGAKGYLLKGALRKEMVAAIRRVHAGQRYIPHEVAAGIAEHVSSDMLSAREIDVLRSAALGRSNKVIASGLGISEETVKGHMRNILMKLEANDRTHAVTIALKRGFLDG
jgi:DNA-binding NarL/FixJ family response regulator